MRISIFSEKLKFHQIHDIAKTPIIPKEYQGFGASRFTKIKNFHNFMIFIKILEISYNFKNFMIFMISHDFYIKSWKRTSPRARTPKSSPNHCNTKRIHRSRRGAMRPETIKTTQNHFFALLGEFLPRINKIGKFLYFH